MKKMILSSLLASLLLTGCDLMKYHPYVGDFDGERHLTQKNLKRLNDLELGPEFHFAFISDTHGWYSELKEEVASLNRRGDIDFVVHCGDLTDTGTSKEYEWSRDILEGISCPWVALIGNHDFLGTGDQAYEVMYGKMDFSFIAGRLKIVCLNTNATEYDYLAAVPNFDFMETEVTADSDRFDRTVLVMHAPPYSDQFNNNVCKAFRRYLDLFPGLLCCVYGHNHNDTVSDIYQDGLLFYGIDCAEHCNYRIMNITPDGYEMEQISY